MNCLFMLVDEEEEKEKDKVKKVMSKIEGENLDDIDMTYEEKAEDREDEKIDITDDKVKDRWSRYIGAMGIEAVAK